MHLVSPISALSIRTANDQREFNTRHGRAADSDSDGPWEVSRFDSYDRDTNGGWVHVGFYRDRVNAQAFVDKQNCELLVRVNDRARRAHQGPRQRFREATALKAAGILKTAPQSPGRFVPKTE